MIVHENSMVSHRQYRCAYLCMPGGLTPILLRRKRLSDAHAVENSPLAS